MTRKDPVSQELLIELETALHALVESFREKPYRYFTEADAHAGLQSWMAGRTVPRLTLETRDGFETGLLHREFPTFFRFSDPDPAERLGPPASRGHYDVVLLNPAYAGSQYAEDLMNRRIRDRGDAPSPPLLAAVEFKLRTWGKRTVDEARRELGKLRLALQEPPDAGAAYLCVLQRDTKPALVTEEEAQTVIEEMVAGFAEICAVVAVCWPNQQREPLVHYSGPWITATT